jgi:signal transduction histidine kinase
MSELIFDLFELARLDSPDLTLRSETFSLGDLAQDVVVKFRLEARKKGIRLNLDLQDGLPLVRGDVGLLDRVLCNLVGNAVRHTPEGGEITVGASAPGGRVRMRVSDSGPGIPPDRLTTVADRGPAEGAGTPADAGSGLGLSIAGKILALHGSPMRVESAPDAGTTISFELPAAP